MVSLGTSQVLSQLSQLLYDFLPGSGNNRTSFPIAAQRAGVAEFWQPGSKLPAINQMLTGVYRDRRSRFCPLILHIVELSLAYQARKAPLSREEVDQLNLILRDLEFQIPELVDSKFLGRLPRQAAPQTPPPFTGPSAPDNTVVASMLTRLMALGSVSPQTRGYEFEKFLNDLFSCYGLAPREAFRSKGEQIDGSFIHRHNTFLLEAKWQAKEVAVQALWSFAARVETKSRWSNGLFVSWTGFTDDGLYAFRQGKPTPLVCMDGLDLYSMLERKLHLEEVIDRKVRRAAETGAAFVSVRDLYL